MREPSKKHRLASLARRRILSQGFAPALALALALASVSCVRSGAPDLRHIVIISIDTLRADHLGCYGHPFVRTPELDAFAARGVLFEQHLSVAPTTLPSHTSLMTGALPRAHGVPRNGFPVPADNRLLAERLRDAGFATAGFIAAMPLSSRFGFARGFDHWDEPSEAFRPDIHDPALERNGAFVTDAVLSWLDDGGAAGRRLFLFAHYFDAHYPYVNGEPWDSMYALGDAGVSGSMADRNRVIGALRRSRPEARALSEGLRGAYAGGVSYVDQQVGRLIRGLDERGIGAEALIVVTADHGEAMDTHPLEYWDHGWSVYDEVLRVPLLLRFPKDWQAGRRVRELVANVDVAPTILDLLGSPAAVADAARGIDGRSFRALIEGPASPVRDVLFVEANKPETARAEADTTWRNERKMRGVRTASHKRIELPVDGFSWLYDLVLDPGERAPLRGGDRTRGSADERALREQLAAWSARPVHEEGARVLDPATREQLRALGYGE